MQVLLLLAMGLICLEDVVTLRVLALYHNGEPNVILESLTKALLREMVVDNAILSFGR